MQGFPVPVKTDDPLLLRSLSGDSWTTYSRTKNLAFFYFIGRPDPSISNSCVSVAATAPQKLASNDWDYPAVCLSDSRGDQCSILHIDATNTFYSACAFGATGSIRIQAFDDCANAPGPAYGCPRTALADIPGVNLLQFSMSANPCTGHLSLVYRKGDEIRLRFYDEQLQEISDTLIAENQSFGNGQTNPGCSNGTIRRCGQGTADCTYNSVPGQCIRDNGRPSIDTYDFESVDGRKVCGAVLAYDSLVKAEDDNLWSKSRLDVVDIADENAIAVESHWTSAEDTFAWNHYLSYATVSRYPADSRHPRISWFWLSDAAGACSVIAEGATSVDLADSMQVTGKIGGPFPAIHISAFGIGDYFGGVRGGDYRGGLLVSWGEPVPTTSLGCIACMGSRWNLATKISRIRWNFAFGGSGVQQSVAPPLKATP